MATDMQEDTPGRVEESATSGAIPGGIEGQVQILLQLVLEQGRQAREDSRATREDLRDMREDSRSTNRRIDRLFYSILGFGSASVVGIAAILIKLFLDG